MGGKGREGRGRGEEREGKGKGRTSPLQILDPPLRPTQPIENFGNISAPFNTLVT